MLAVSPSKGEVILAMAQWSFVQLENYHVEFAIRK